MVNVKLTKRYASSPAGQIHHVTCGSGAPLVLLGPAPRSWRAFEQMFPLLAGDFHLIAPDPPGFGNSDPPSADATMKEIAASVVAVLDDLGIGRAHVYGHNTGRLIAAALAAHWPARVDRLIIAGPTFTLIPEQETRINAIRDFVKARYFDDSENEGSSLTDPAIRKWATTYRTMIGDWWWTDGIFRTTDPGYVIEALENRLIDELAARRTVNDMYRINFDFDFADALAKAEAKTRIIEITGGSADSGGFERQGKRLAAVMEDASAITLSQTEEALALFLLTGLEPMAEAIREFLR